MLPPFPAPGAVLVPTATAPASGTASGPCAQQMPDQMDLSAVHVKAKYWSYEAFPPSQDVPRFLAHDLDVKRLDMVYPKLWWAGRQCPPRPLHRLKMLGRTIAVTEQADLHLVWSDENCFVKPLPDYLLSHRFWTAHICRDADLYAAARGFLLTYVWLMRNKSDFELAKASSLLPDALTWPIWSNFVGGLADEIDLQNPGPISKRYRYGELRLSRLDQIYRLDPSFGGQYLLKGYLYSYSSYGGFFRREFAWLVVAFAYISIILSAMQVGLTTKELQEDASFNRGAFGFSVVAIVFPVAISGVVLLLYIGLWIYHVMTTLYYHRGSTRREEKQERHFLETRTTQVGQQP